MTHYLKSFSICFLLGLLPWWSQAAEGRYALIIGIGQYSPDSGASVLPGIPKDMENVRKIARAMEIEERNIVELRDAQATRKNIVQALEKLRQQVQNGDQVLIYFSGHGTRLSAAGRCSEGLITYTPGAYTVADLLSEEDLARYTQPISQKADKLITLFDSCFSGGVLAARTRSLAQDLGIRPRFSPAASECSVPVNDRNTRSFAPVMTRLGAAQENFVQIAAANYNEVSWDFPTIGGLATHSLTQCLLGDASDLNRSGAVSLDEVRQCAQAKVDAAMKPFASTGRAPSTIQVRGARNLIVVPTQPQAALAPPPPPAPPRPAAATGSPSTAPKPTPMPAVAQTTVPAAQAPAPVQMAQAPMPAPAIQTPAPAPLAQIPAPMVPPSAPPSAPPTAQLPAPVQVAQATAVVAPPAAVVAPPAAVEAPPVTPSPAVPTVIRPAPAQAPAPVAAPAPSTVAAGEYRAESTTQPITSPTPPPTLPAVVAAAHAVAATGAAAAAADAPSAATPAPLIAQAIVRPMPSALPEPEKPAEQLLASAATLQDIYAMRNGRLKLEVSAPEQLTIDKDPLQFSVRSNTAGYLYAVMLGSDGRSFYLLFPNKLDGDNRIKANTTYRFPRPGWAVKAGGPEGVNHLLFVVSQSPRDPRVFVPTDSGDGGGPFTFAVTDLIARQRLVDFFIGRGVQGRNRLMVAQLLTIKEVP
jgi:hypothetical protein